MTELILDRIGGAAAGAIVDLAARSVPAVAPALAIVVAHDDETILALTAGRADADTRFDLASITKTFTATAFLAQVSEGRVALDDAVIDVVPGFGTVRPRTVDGGQEPLTRTMLPVPRERAAWTVDPAAVTFRQLLTHTSGMAPWRAIFRDAGPVPAPPSLADDEVEARWASGLAAVYAAPFVDRPGRDVHYSDLGYMTLGDAVGRIDSSPPEEVIAARVTRPLGLGSIVYRPLRAGVALERIAPTSRDDDWRHRRCHGEVEDENAAGLGGVAGHAGLFGTAADLARFGRAWLAGGGPLAIDGDLAATATADATAEHSVGRGLGWQVRRDDDGFLDPLSAGSFGHTGFTGTSLAIDPRRRLVVVILTDRVHAGRRHTGIEDLRWRLHRHVEALPS